jgi:hypothetical protein
VPGRAALLHFGRHVAPAVRGGVVGGFVEQFPRTHAHGMHQTRQALDQLFGV